MMKKSLKRLVPSLLLFLMASANAEPITCAYKAKKSDINNEYNVVYDKTEENDNVFVRQFNQWMETGYSNHPVKATLQFKNNTYQCELISTKYNGVYTRDGYIECGPFTFSNSVANTTVKDERHGFNLDRSRLQHPHWAKWAHKLEKNKEKETYKKYLVLNWNFPAKYIAGHDLNYQLNSNLDRCKRQKVIPASRYNRKGFMCIESVVCENGVAKTTISQDIILLHPRIAKVLKEVFSYNTKIISASSKNFQDKKIDMKNFMEKHQKGFDNPYNLVLRLTVTNEAPYKLERKEESPL